MKKLSFKIQVILFTVSLLLISGAIVVISNFGLGQVRENYEFVVQKAMPKMRLAFEMGAEYEKIRIKIVKLSLGKWTSTEEKSLVQSINENLDAYEKLDKEYVGLGFIPRQKDTYEAMNQVFLRYKELIHQIADLQARGNPADSQKIQQMGLKEGAELGKLFEAAQQKLVAFHLDVVKNRSHEAAELGDRTTLIDDVTGAAGVLLGLLLGLAFANLISKRILQIAESLNESSSVVSSASQQMASASQQLSQASTEQAASLEQTAASIEQLSSMVNQNSESAKRTAQTSEESLSKSNEGKATVEKMTRAMEEIDQANSEIQAQMNLNNQQLAEVVTVIQNIGSKTKVINDIVFQTKLLSFNASVEAARAGENGKGFAVVAEEVGNLAQMSGSAAQEISAMLEESIGKVTTMARETKSKIDQLVELGQSKVKVGVSIAQECDQILSQLVQNVQTVSTDSASISSASQEQAQGISEINKAVNQLDQVTQQNAAATNETASAAEKLSSQVTSMKANVGLLLETIRGKSAAQATPKGEAAPRKMTPAKKASPKSIPPSRPKADVPKEIVLTPTLELPTASALERAPDRNDPGFSE